jgi:hypothetical protein
LGSSLSLERQTSWSGTLFFGTSKRFNAYRSADEGSGPAAARPKALVVEDDLLVLRLSAQMLRRDGFDVVI